jgi:hypothetical protein
MSNRHTTGSAYFTQRKEGYESPAAKSRIRFACCTLRFPRLTNKLICSLHNSVKSLCVYTKIIQGVGAQSEEFRKKNKNRIAVVGTRRSGVSVKNSRRRRYGFCGSGRCGSAFSRSTVVGASLVPAGCGFKLKSTPRAAFSFTVRCKSTFDSSTALSPPYEVT